MKLTDSQLVILSGAAKRADGGVLPFPKSVRLNKGAGTLVLKSLLKHKLVAEKPADRSSEAWREGKGGERYALFITPAGLKAIGIEALPESRTGSAPVKAGEKPQKPSRIAAGPKTQPETARKGTKLATLIELLSRKTGATIEEAAKATGWQKHSVRGAMSGALKKKMGLQIQSSVTNRGRIYRIGPAS